MLQSMKVIGGGIDVLEAIGRKTYDVLAEGEHGLKKTIVKTRENRPTLSQVSACCLAALHARGSIVLIVLFIYLLIYYLFIYFIWCWGTGIRGLMRGMATILQGNQELLVVTDKVGRLPGELVLRM